MREFLAEHVSTSLPAGPMFCTPVSSAECQHQHLASSVASSCTCCEQVRHDCEAKAAELIIQLRLVDIDIQRAERDIFDFKRSFLKAHNADGHNSKHKLVIEGDKLLGFLQARVAAANEAASKMAVKLNVTKVGSLFRDCVARCLSEHFSVPAHVLQKSTRG